MALDSATATRRGSGFSCNVRQRHVFAGAHFDQPADGAGELMAVRTFAIQIDRSDLG